MRAAGCFYDPEIMLPNSWDHFQVAKINSESSRSFFDHFSSTPLPLPADGRPSISEIAPKSEPNQKSK